MKKVLFPAMFCIAVLSNYAQNWQPLKNTNSYNYKLGDTSLITHVIKTDSISIIDGDSVFYLNRIMTDCDTCSNNEEQNYALRNQPQFLMRKMIKKSDSIFVFNDTSEFIIKPLAKLNQNWLFDSANLIEATCSVTDTVTIFGTTDSIKEIFLSNGKTILLGKSFGILDFPSKDDASYHLVGIEGEQMFGEKLPGFYEFLNFSTGDIFQRKYFRVAGGDGDSEEYIEKYTITSKVSNEDTITYDIHVYRCTWGYQDGQYLDTTAVEFNSILRYVNSTKNFTNQYPNQIYDIKNFMGGDESLPPMLNKIVFTNTNNNLVKYVGDIDNIEPYPHYHPIDSLSDILVRNNEYVMQFGFCGYKAGFGQEYFISEFEFHNKLYYTGKIHNGETIGSVKPDSFFKYYLGINQFTSKDLKIYPNPATKTINISLDQNIVKGTIVISDLQGKTAITKSFSRIKPVKSIDISNLNTGIYIVFVQNSNQVYGVQKLIVQ